MTVKQLSQLYWLNREIEEDQRRLDRLQAEVESISSPGADGMPRGGSSRHGKVEHLAAEIVDLQAIIAAKQIQCIHERCQLERYIAGIPDSLTRMVFTFRFVNGLPWSQVAACIGGNNTEYGVKKICYRYLKQEEKTCPTCPEQP